MSDSARSTIDNLNAIINEFDAQVDLDMQNIYKMSETDVKTAKETDDSKVNGDTADEDDPSEENTDAKVEEPQTGKEESTSDQEKNTEKKNIEDKNWLFEENIRLKEVERHLAEEKARLENYEKELNEKAEEIEAMNKKFLNDRVQFRDEMNILTGQVTRERQRLKQDEQFFDKKMEILKAGFADLDKAKRELEAEKMRYEAQNSYYGDDDIPGYGAPVAKTLFVGITNPLMLKKRYKDLVKIYHPDNLAGDHDLFKAITIEYERLQGKIGSEGIG
ncbi:MAG: hypothetical protein K6G12_04230 [Lachnospiraceae bacterium]|nr:hypothetical protein [Lachnospiraceae bacterium]